jgi:ribosomal protein S18 acetylase RimI-like enzyme
VGITGRLETDTADRARAWHYSRHAAICDVVEPWAHGTVVRATRYPSYYDFNLVRVEEEPAMSLEALVAVADEALAGLAHRRLDFELVDVGERLRRRFEAKGWKALRLLLMRHEAAPPPGPDVGVEEVPYDAVHELRVAWHREDFPGQDPGGYHIQAREVALRRGAQVLAVRKGRTPVAFAQLVRGGAGAEISEVYVHPEHRGGGLGTALTRAAIEAAGSVRDLWISADDEDRPKELYGRLGFRPVWTELEFTRLP